ncbi:ATP-binding protein [Pseudooceanicola sp. CBS1P-1]|uniref:Histidine kinase/HSP90-like ATPase domain-containing protein n=1 Tax=Pseudooceanicola albus TaxID=2692189 RepID=A0A6L7G5N2_9RHOB|nr:MULTISPECIES: ATP-binding protein [Pseudooceanicola]MBT9383021.1 ATP-binding protein [Pseudooceanicola endophyticus]MXN19209.1 hypothetical protein [Pseudooceanicola albus]
MSTTVLEMPPRLDEIDGMVLSIKDTARTCLSEEKIASLEVALSEALANAVKHGLSPNLDVPIKVTVVQTDKELKLQIVDAGEPGPVNLFEDVKDLDDIDPMAESGRGLSLIRFCVDRLHFEPQGNRNFLELVFTSDLNA